MFQNIAFASFLALCVSSVVVVQGDVADKKFLESQKAIYDIVSNIYQPQLDRKLYDTGKGYNIRENLDAYKHGDDIQDFLDIYEGDMLSRGEVFSVFYPTHRDQAVALFKVFYYSKDFDTLYKTAAWARINVNEGLFIYAFSVAVFHHPETRHMRIPALHEIYPNLYFDDEVIRQAYDAKTQIDPAVTSHDEPIIIHANYSKFYQQYHWHDENKISYFTEDVPNNEIHYLGQISHPFWLSAKEFPEAFESRGDRYLYGLRAWLTRFNMERLSNGLGEIEDFDWNYPIPYGYQPSYSYRNGLSFPHREENAHFPSYNYKWIQALQKWENSILTAIDTGFAIDSAGEFKSIHNDEGLKILGNLIEGNANSINPGLYGNYDMIARTVLGCSPPPLNKYKVFPSTLQHYGLAQRDPIYWSLAQKIVGFYERFASKLPPHSYERVSFPAGEKVKIESVEVEDIITFFTPYDYLISGAVKRYGPHDKTVIKARQYRLDHKPYSYNVTVTSDKDRKASMKVFLGPNSDIHGQEIGINENWKNFLFVDEIPIDLKAGLNTITRSSLPPLYTAPDELSGDLFYNNILKAINGDGTYDVPNRITAYPERLLIPRGTEEGLELQFYIFIAPHNDKRFESKSPLLGYKNFSDDPFNFPLDRPVFPKFIELSNGFFKAFKVYHKKESQINRTSE